MATSQPDRLSGAARLATASLVVFAASLSSLLLDPLLHSRDELARSARAVDTLELSTLAWVPSGRLLRHPAMGHRGVDLRPSSSFALPAAAPEQLLLAPRLPPQSEPPRPEGGRSLP